MNWFFASLNNCSAALCWRNRWWCKVKEHCLTYLFTPPFTAVYQGVTVMIHQINTWWNNVGKLPMWTIFIEPTHINWSKGKTFLKKKDHCLVYTFEY